MLDWDVGVLMGQLSRLHKLWGLEKGEERKRKFMERVKTEKNE